MNAFGSVENINIPLNLMVKTVSQDCNLACDYCYYSHVKGKLNRIIRKIDINMLKKIIYDYMKMSNGSAEFTWHGGEPLLAGLEFFEEVIYMQAKYAPPNTTISNALQTNATLIDEKWAQFFKKYNFLIGVSLDGPEEIHNSKRMYRNGSGSYREVMRGINSLRKHNVEFNILTVIHENNVNRAVDLMDFYNNENFQYVQFIPAMNFKAQESESATSYLITPLEYGEFLCKVFDIWFNAGEPKISIRFFDNMLNGYLNQEAELCINRKTCSNTLVIEQNGDVYPCDFFISNVYQLGNINNSQLEDLMFNENHDNFLRKKKELSQKCMNCDFLRLCYGGCPRNRIGDKDNVLSADYFCESYKMIYQYAHERMKIVARNVRISWLNDYLKSGGKEPGRNEPCICGSGNKYKKCCGPLRDQIGVIR